VVVYGISFSLGERLLRGEKKEAGTGIEDVETDEKSLF
jgi:hypothetical protein